MGTLGVGAPPYEVGASMGNPGSATGSVYIPLEDHQTSYIPDIQTSNTKNLYVFQTEVVPVWGGDVPDVYPATDGHVNGECGDRWRTAHRETLSLLSHVVVRWTPWRQGCQGIQWYTGNTVHCVSNFENVGILLAPLDLVCFAFRAHSLQTQTLVVNGPSECIHTEHLHLHLRLFTLMFATT